MFVFDLSDIIDISIIAIIILFVIINLIYNELKKIRKKNCYKYKNSQQFKWAKEIMEEKKANILDINWNKFKTKEEIEKFIDMLINATDKLFDEDKR